MLLVPNKEKLSDPIQQQPDAPAPPQPKDQFPHNRRCQFPYRPELLFDYTLGAGSYQIVTICTWGHLVGPKTNFCSSRIATSTRLVDYSTLEAPNTELEGAIPFQDQRILGYFLRLTPLRFSSEIRDYAHEFLIACRKWLQTLRFSESRGIEFTTYQLDGPVRQWWRTFRVTRPADALPITWAKFSNIFMTRFVLKSLKNKLYNQFTCLEQIKMIVFQYEVRFQELSRYATTILPIKQERICFFVRGLRPQLRIGKHIVNLGLSYLDIVDIADSIKQFS